VNTQQNARLTVWGRAEAVRRLLQDGEPVTLVAAALHVSPRTLYKWRARFSLKERLGCSTGPPHCTTRRGARRAARSSG
jgi:transposase-like protein